MSESKQPSTDAKQPMPPWLRITLAYGAGVLMIGPCYVIALLVCDPLDVALETITAMRGAGAGPWLSWLSVGLPGFVAFAAIGLTIPALARHKGALHSLIYGVVVGLAGLAGFPGEPGATGASPAQLGAARAMLMIAAWLGSWAGGGLWLLITRRHRRAAPEAGPDSAASE